MKVFKNLKEIGIRLAWTVFFLFLVRAGLLITLPIAIGQDLILETGRLQIKQDSFFALHLGPYLMTNIFIFLFLSRIQGYQQWRNRNPELVVLFTQVLILIVSFCFSIWHLWSVLKGGNLDLDLVQDSSNDPSTLIFLYIYAILFYTLGTTVLQWISHLITNKGIGNGVFLIILMFLCANLSTYLQEEHSTFLEISYLNRAVFFFGLLGAIFFIIRSEKMRKVSSIPFNVFWKGDPLEAFFKNDVKRAFYAVFYSMQSVEFYTLLLSNIIQLVASSMLDMNKAESNWVLLELLIQFYSIWVSCTVIIWFFYASWPKFLKEHIHRIFVISCLPGFVIERDLGDWLLYKSQKNIQTLMIRITTLKLGPFLFFLIYLLLFQEFETNAIFVFNYINQISFILFFFIRGLLLIIKQLQNQYWGELFYK